MKYRIAFIDCVPGSAVPRCCGSTDGRVRLLGSWLIWSLAWAFLGTSLAVAQVNDRSIAPVGLVVHWEGSLGGAGLAQEEQSLAIWAHSTERREFVDVFSGNRLLERIDARQVDRAALERLILEGKPTSPVPTLGLQGAQEKAAKLVKTYAVLGRSLTVKTFSEPIVYIVALAANGILTALDGESGELLWQTSLPRPELQLLGPGVSDDYVTVVNGNSYFAMRLQDGTLVQTRRLTETATAPPMPLRDKILVPSTLGRLIAYDIKNPNLYPVVLRAASENRIGTTLSSDRRFIAWTSKNSLFLAHDENQPTMWNQVNVGEACVSRPVATPKGFLFCSNYGSVVHVSTERTNSLLWRTNLAMQTTRPPIVGNKDVFVLSDDGQCEALDLETGNALWPQTAKRVNRILGVGKEHLYVRDTSGMLASLRLSDGRMDGRTSALLQQVVPNSINDRLFVVTRDGRITCLREEAAVQPTMYVEFNPGDKKSSSAPQPSSSEPSRTEPSATDDPFGSDPVQSAPARGDSTDPFDPFGGG